MCVGGEGQRSIGGRQSPSGEPPSGDQDEGRHSERGQKGPGPGPEDLAPRRVGGHTKEVAFDPIGRVGLGDVQPVLLRQFDQHPDKRDSADQELPGRPLRVPAEAICLVEDKEVLEGVGEDQQQPTQVGELEQGHAHQSPVEEEAADPERKAVHPVAQRRDVGDGQVVDVERLVIALVALQRQAGELLKDRLVSAVEQQRGHDAGQRISRDGERQEKAGRSDDPEDQPVGCVCYG